MSTGRLRLTPLIVDDADAMVTVLGDRRMYEFIGGAPPTLEELRERYRRLAMQRSATGDQHWFNWIVRLAPDRAVGVVQATVAADRAIADVAWEIGVPRQGRGLATEAAAAMVDWLRAEGVGTVRACIHPDHHASAAVAARVGLTRTDEVVDGEVVWASASPQFRHNANSPERERLRHTRGQSSTGRGMNSAEAGEPPAMASAARITAAAVYEVCSSNGKRVGGRRETASYTSPVQ